MRTVKKSLIGAAIAALVLGTPGLAEAAPTPTPSVDPAPSPSVGATAPATVSAAPVPAPTTVPPAKAPVTTAPTTKPSTPVPTTVPAPSTPAPSVTATPSPSPSPTPSVSPTPSPTAPAYSAPIQAVLAAHRQILGAAQSAEFDGLNNTRVVRFDNGVIIMNKVTNAAYAVYGAIYGEYGRLGWEGGLLGRPISNEEAGKVAGARVSRFERGVIIWSLGTGARAVYGTILETYSAMGREASPVGLPTTSEVGAGKGARTVTFQRGVILYSAGTGARPVYGAIFEKYGRLGFERGALGLPRTAEFGGQRGSRVQNFEGGQIIWSAGTGANSVYGAIAAAYASMGWEGGVLGLPLTDEFAGQGGARVNRFQGGIIIWKANTGAFAVRGSILGEYARQGFEGGSLGAPIGDEMAVSGGWTQDFESGRISLINGSYSIVRPGHAVDSRCRTGRVLCVSKADRKLRWMIDGRVVREFDARFGSTGTPTREGSFTVFRKVRNDWSYLYNSPMPFSMYFSGGQAVHYSADFAARGYAGASHGCVNIRDHAGLQWLYDTQVRVGDKVVVYW